MKNKLLFSIVAIALVAVGLFAYNSAKQQSASPTVSQPTISSAKEATEASKPKDISYRGKEGKTALALLESNATVEVSGSGANAFVVAIGGYKPDVKGEFWAFYVNGKQAEVGAGSYITKADDLIEWKLEEIKN